MAGLRWERMTYVAITTILAFAAYLLPGITITQGTIIFFASLVLVILAGIPLVCWSSKIESQN